MNKNSGKSFDLFEWPRAPRSSHLLGREKGLYALFLRPEATLPVVRSGRHGLIYLGKTSAKRGLKGRCHFDGKTKNHSPRKSLAFLLREELGLLPTPITKSNPKDNTWGLETHSEDRLTQWMHQNLLLAINFCEKPEPIEKALIKVYAPSLNLDGCDQSERHTAISEGRLFMKKLAFGSED